MLIELQDFLIELEEVFLLEGEWLSCKRYPSPSLSKEERLLAIKKPLVRQVETKKKSQICNGQERLLNAPLHNNEMACKKLCHICVVLLPIHLQSVLYWKEMMVLLQKCLLMLATFSRYYIVCKKVTNVCSFTHIYLSDTDWLFQYQQIPDSTTNHIWI